MIQSTPSILRRLFPNDIIWEKANDEKIIYLTFDDGPIPEVTPLILEILKEHNAKATFFMVGENVEKYGYLLDRIIKEGHSVGNHSYNHLKGWSTTDDLYFENIKKASKLIPGNLFRPPYGRILPRQARALLTDYQIIMWSVLSKDYNQKLSSEDVFQNVRRKSKSGSIIVFHDSQKAKKNVLPALSKTLKFLSEEGYQFGVL